MGNTVTCKARRDFPLGPSVQSEALTGTARSSKMRWLVMIAVVVKVAVAMKELCMNVLLWQTNIAIATKFTVEKSEIFHISYVCEDVC